jgi:hypothetical protein
MKLIDLFTVGGVFSAIAAITGWWIKSRLDASIKHEWGTEGTVLFIFLIHSTDK